MGLGGGGPPNHCHLNAAGQFCIMHGQHMCRSHRMRTDKAADTESISPSAIFPTSPSIAPHSSPAARAMLYW